MSRIEELYRELEKHEPSSPESYRIAEQIVEEIFTVVPEVYPMHGPCC